MKLHADTRLHNADDADDAGAAEHAHAYVGRIARCVPAPVPCAVVRGDVRGYVCGCARVCADVCGHGWVPLVCMHMCMRMCGDARMRRMRMRMRRMRMWMRAQV